MRPGVVLLTVVMSMAGAGVAAAQKGKPAPAPTIVNWRCDVVMRDATGDAITSDVARTGVQLQPYIDGVGAFTCGMSPMESAEAGNPVAGSATFYFGRAAQRAFFFPPRSGAWAGGYDTNLQIRVLSLVNMPQNEPQLRAMNIPTSLVGAMYADNLGEGDAVTDLVTVERMDACTWVVTFDAQNAAVERYKSQVRGTLLGTPQLPLGFTLTTRAPAGSTIAACPSLP